MNQGVLFSDDAIAKLNPEQRAQIAAQSGATSPAANNKRRPCHEQVEAKKAPRFDRPVSIAYLEHRNRLADSDGPFTKYVTDAIVTASILRDDSTQEIPRRPTHEQVKDKEEYTEIEIYEA